MTTDASTGTAATAAGQTARPYPHPPPLTRERRLSIILRPPADDAPGAGHSGGVGCLLLGGGGTPTTLFSGSRDATVRAWGPPAAAASASSPRVSAPTAVWRGHGGWVTALACPGDGVIASGSADRTIKLWRGCGGGLEGACGADAGADGDHPGPSTTPSLLATLAAHADYVTCLAASPAGAPGRLASAGLGTQVLLWDVGAAVAVSSVQVGGGGATSPPSALPADPTTTPWRPPVAEAAAARDSVYALAMDGAGSLIAAGAPAGALRLADARTGSPAAALRGHAPDAVVRAVALSADGRRALSGASDRTVRLWDVGTRRCIAVLAVHTDSVWALAVGEGGGRSGGGRAGGGGGPTTPAHAWGEAFLSGGRDGRVYRTDARARCAALVCEGDEPVTALAWDGAGGMVWVGRERASTVEAWRVPPPPAAASAGPTATATTPVSVASPTAAAAAAAAPGARPAALPPGGSFPVSASPLVRARQTFFPATGDPSAAQRPPRPAPPPAATAPVAVAPGSAAPPLVGVTVLPDRRRVLAQALDSRVEEWDVAAGCIVAAGVSPPGSAPGDALAAAARARWEPAAVPPWFSADCSSGRLALVLAPPACFSAEMYASDLGWTDAPDDLKVNAGQELLRAALGRWSGKQHHRAGGKKGSGGDAPPPTADAAADAATTPAPPPVYFRLAGADPAGPAAAGQGGPPTPPPGAPPALVMGEGGDPAGLPWVVPAASFTGAEPSPAIIPAWAADAVLRGRLAGEKSGRGDAKVAFLLTPAPGSGLPSLSPTRLSAPRVLPLHKVATYAATKLAEAGVDVRPLPCFWDAAAQAAADAGVAAEDAAAEAAALPPPPRLELTIAGAAAPFDLSLAAARAHLWRRGEDLPIAYRLVRGGEARAPRPVIKPPRE